MPLHIDLTEVDLHENKGVSASSADTVATSNGAGATVWRKVVKNSIDATSIFNVNKFPLTVKFEDVTVADKIYVVVPCAATLNSVYGVIEGAIGTADEPITIKNNGGSLAGTLTFPTAGSAAGDVQSVTCSVNNTFTSGQKVVLETGGLSTGTVSCTVTLIFTATGAM